MANNEESRRPKVEMDKLDSDISKLSLNKANEFEREFLNCTRVLERRIDRLEGRAIEQGEFLRDDDVRLIGLEKFKNVLSSYWSVIVGLAMLVAGLVKFVETIWKFVK